MALTYLFPVKGDVGASIRYVRNPGKTTENRRYVTYLNCTGENARAQFLETKRIWTALTGTDKTAGITCYHGWQSFFEGEVTAELAHEIGVRLARRLWGDRYEVVVATHCNTKCYHNHFVLNSVSFADGRKHPGSYTELPLLRAESDRLCAQYGLKAVDDPRRGMRVHPLAYRAEAAGKPTVRGLIRQDIDRAVRESATREEFFGALQEMGYEVRLYDEKGKPLKRPVLKPHGAQSFFRFDTLAYEGYSLDELLEKVSYNYHRIDPFPEEEAEKLKAYRKQTEPKIPRTGIRALYIRYCYELRILSKFPGSVKKVSFFVKEDLRRLDRLDEQTRFLTDNGIETVGDLHAFREKAETDCRALVDSRQEAVKACDRAYKAGRKPELEQARKRKAELTAEIRKVRKAIRLTELIEQRSEPMERELSELDRQREEAGKEEKNERYVGGRGGAGREDDARKR